MLDTVLGVKLEHATVWLSIGVVLLLLYPIVGFVYNVTLHPLSRYPGPLLWRGSRIPWLISIWSGRFHEDVQKIHKKYGSVVRLAPTELSFADERAWQDIYSNHGTSTAFPKSEVWHIPSVGRPLTLNNCIDFKVHARMKRQMEVAFTERAVARQEDLVQHYVSLMIRRLREKVTRESSTQAVVNIVPWFIYVAVDIISDLSFGEPFGCLESENMGDWISFVFNSLRSATCVATLRHYVWVTWILERMIPKSVKATADAHWNVIVEKLTRRLAQDSSRPDFVDEWLRDEKEKNEPLSRDELYGNVLLMTIAGSDTVSTALSGTVNHLVKNPGKLAVLTQEVRTRFDRESEITFAALADMPYLNGCLWEGLRMCNPTPVGLTRITPPEGGMVCGNHLPGGVFVYLHPLTLSFSPWHFHEPDNFIPERWLDEAIKDPASPFYNDHRACIEPFGVGPQSCIGQPLAWAELRLILAKLVWAFDVKEERGTEAGRLLWENQRVFTVVEKSPFDVRLCLRE